MARSLRVYERRPAHALLSSSMSDIVTRWQDSNARSRATWEKKPVGSQRARAVEGSAEYFEQIRQYRYGYESPWLLETFAFSTLRDKRVLEIGVGLGIDACELIRAGARYTGVDITARHLSLAETNVAQQFPDLVGDASRVRFYQGDLTQIQLTDQFDVIYSFGVFHHIAHESEYLDEVRKLMAPGARFILSLYARHSFFNMYMIGTWLLRNRCQVTLPAWQSHLAEGSPLDEPVVIKIRSRAEVQHLLRQRGFHIRRYVRRGFVQNYIPFIGKWLRPDGWTLNALGSFLGWYHCLECTAL